MKHIIVTFFCGFLSSGNSQAADNENSYRFQPEPAMEPIVENQIWPIQTYHTFRGNFYGTARRSINPNCVRHSGPQDLNSREREYMTLEKPMQNHFVPSPTRRTSFLEAKKKSLNNVEPKFSNEGGSSTSRLQNQVVPKYQDPNALRSQPQVLKEAEPTSFRMNTQIKKDEESGISRPPPQVPKEINLVKIQPQDLKNEGSALRIQTPIVKHEESHALNNQPQEFKDEGSKTYRTVSKVTPEVETNTLRTQVSSQKEDVANTFRNQPPVSKDDGPSTIKTQTHMVPNEDSKSLRSSSSVENLQKPPSIDNEKSVYDNTIVNFSGEKVVREESEDLANSAPAYTVERVESYSFEGNTDHLVSPSLPLDSKHLMTKGHCSEDKPAIALEPQPRRRLLMSSKNDDSKTPNFDKKEVVRSNNDDQPEIIIASNTKSLRANAANQVNEASNQIENISGKNTKSNDNKTNEYDNANSKSSSYEKPFEKSPHRAGKLQFFADPKSNEIKDPTKGQGISYIKKTTLMLMDYDRVCYACSTANSPTCLFPDRRTGVKYCRKGDNACVTKTFGSGSTLTLIRDCARSCDDSEPGFAPNYKSCGICYTDLCNSAYSIKVHSLILTIPTLVAIVFIKPLL